MDTNITTQSAPYCETCKHHHEQGVKCAICGHIGRSTIFLKMKQKALKCAKMRFELYGPEIYSDRSTGLYDLVMEVRKIIFCEAMGTPLEAEFVRNEEANSAHYLGFVGNAPICTARFHSVDITSDPNNGTHSIVVIDRFGVLPAYRRRGYGKQCFDSLIVEIKKKVIENTRIILKLPRLYASASEGGALVEMLRSTAGFMILQEGTYSECQFFPQTEEFVLLEHF